MSENISRREAIKLISLGAAGTVVGVPLVLKLFGARAGPNAPGFIKGFFGEKELDMHAKETGPTPLEQRISQAFGEDIQLDSPTSYAPMVNSKSQHLGDSFFGVYNPDNSPAAGIYVPINYLDHYDGGWLMKRDLTELREFQGKFPSDRTYDIKIKGNLKQSEEFPGTYKMLVPSGCFPLDSKGKIYIDTIGRFFTDSPYKKIRVGHNSAIRKDVLDKSAYKDIPDGFTLNRKKTRFIGQSAGEGYYKIFTPTWLYNGIGVTASRLDDAGIVPSGLWRSKGDYISSNVCYINNLLLDQVQLMDNIRKTRLHYSYPEDSGVSAVIESQYYQNFIKHMPHSTLSLLEFLNVQPYADCDVANTEFMLRQRANGYKTRLAIGYMTGNDGFNSTLHGWSEILGRSWTIADATPYIKSDSRLLNKSIERSDFVRIYK